MRSYGRNRKNVRAGLETGTDATDDAEALTGTD
ncbi:hypothetical protein SAMN04489841_2857 [Natrinema salaciae]|uniref:Uncharacterized protein n=1 Tax=Natrinema salaciae TaxID=1186196 RepID=A0A1H9KAD5_9EURY|nr:hypothetical protein SAMN04489841_2857 [Natrinema salaciae]